VTSDQVPSPLLPGGDLVAAALHREVMALADRGGASGMVGARWADLCAAQAKRWVGKSFPIPGTGEPKQRHRIVRIVRLDDRPAIGETAARRALQNPDILLIGERDSRVCVQAADAKFSVETARAKQVSAAVVAGLLTLGELLTDLAGDFGPDPELVDGLFLCPDFPLTHLILRRRWGIVRTTVRAEQVAILPAPARPFFAPLESASLMPALASVDDLPISIDDSLLAGLYYFRLARAAVGCWLDASGPLLPLGDKDRPAVDEPAILAEAVRRVPQARSAWELILGWDVDVQPVRAQRMAVDQVTALPIANRDLRQLIARMAAKRDLVEGPSVNKVRRLLGAWYRGQIQDRVGPLPPPVDDFTRTFSDLGRIAASLSSALDAESRRLITDLLDQATTNDSLPAIGENTSAVATSRTTAKAAGSS
jgi:hypothetical protein